MHFTSCQILEIMNIEQMQRWVEKGKSQNFRVDDDLEIVLVLFYSILYIFIAHFP